MIPAFLVRRFGKTGAKAVFFGAIALALLIGFLIVYLTGRTDGAARGVIDQQNREIKTIVAVGDANTNASDARVVDAHTAAVQTEELSDAISNAQGPDDLRARRGCAIMRQQGRDTSGIPACR